MRIKLLVLACFVGLLVSAQSKGTNAIKVSGVTFKEVANALLDAGYSFDKTDSNFQTIKTEFKQSKSVSTLQISLYVRVKDSSAVITGKVYI